MLLGFGNIRLRGRRWPERSGRPKTHLANCDFGEVIEGQEVVDAMKVVPTGRVGGYDDVPREAIVIESAVVLD